MFGSGFGNREYLPRFTTTYEDSCLRPSSTFSEWESGNAFGSPEARTDESSGDYFTPIHPSIHLNSDPVEPVCWPCFDTATSFDKAPLSAPIPSAAPIPLGPFSFAGHNPADAEPSVWTESETEILRSPCGAPPPTPVAVTPPSDPSPATNSAPKPLMASRESRKTKPTNPETLRNTSPTPPSDGKRFTTTSPENTDCPPTDKLSALRRHRKVEKQYRARLSIQFQRLIDVLPAEHQHRPKSWDRRLGAHTPETYEKPMSKGEVLDAATQRIKHLEQEGRVLRREVNQLSWDLEMRNASGMAGPSVPPVDRFPHMRHNSGRLYSTIAAVTTAATSTY